jgi:hypothetical protein
MSFLNNPDNNSLFISGDGMDNRYMSVYPTLAKVLFGCEAEIIYNPTYANLKIYIHCGNAVQICLKNPGHYIAAGDINSDGEILTMNSWGTQPGLKNGGVNEVLTEHEYNTNVHSGVIVYFKPEESRIKNSQFAE